MVVRQGYPRLSRTGSWPAHTLPLAPNGFRADDLDCVMYRAFADACLRLSTHHALAGAPAATVGTNADGCGGLHERCLTPLEVVTSVAGSRHEESVDGTPRPGI